jgi:hypothetical protein
MTLRLMKLSIQTVSIITCNMLAEHNDAQQNDNQHFDAQFNKLSKMKNDEPNANISLFPECHNAECHYAECRGALCSDIQRKHTENFKVFVSDQNLF